MQIFLTKQPLTLILSPTGERKEKGNTLEFIPKRKVLI
jgi:hypothetical protein